MRSFIPRQSPRITAPISWLALAAMISWCWASCALADVVVIANRTRDDISFRILDGTHQQQLHVAAGHQQMLRHTGSCQILYELSDRSVRYQLDANSVYFFTLNDQERLEFRKVDLGGSQAVEDAPQEPKGAADSEPAQHGSHPSDRQTAAIPVKILVDNREPTPRSVWEPRLRKRIGRVSDVLQAHCGLRLKIVAMETWNSGDQPISFRQSLAEFRQRVDPDPGCLAIGFTGRYQRDGSIIDLGSTQGMLQSHILIREWTDSMSEPERDEVLLHEIGHYLGAVHSPEPTSVMRPILADDKAIRR